MDEDLFKQKLSEVADWKIPETPRETSVNAKKKRGRKSNEEQYMETREEIFYEEFDGINPTLHLMLTRVKYKPTTCDCGRICEDGCEKEAKLYQKNEKSFWRMKCKTCGFTQNPITGKYDLTGLNASIIWAGFLRDCKNPKEINEACLPRKKSNPKEF
mgnify:CR=1 FL=1